MKKNLRILGIVGVLVVALAGCSLFGPDAIVGSWQQVSVNGSSTASLVRVVEFTATTYTDSVLGAQLDAGTWTKSWSTYTLTGAIFGIIGTTTTFTPTFTSSNNTLTYTATNGDVYVYNRQ